MPNWRRARIPGGSYFFTVVTDRRRAIFSFDEARTLLGTIVRECQQEWPFEVHSVVLLPDHLHSIWLLPAGDDRYSQRWAWIKSQFTKRWLSSGGVECEITDGRSRDGRRGVWQPKFWEHTLRDENDLERHSDYIHFNPVKHGYVECPADWPWSSLHKWIERGVYPKNWACGQSAPPRLSDVEDTVGE